MVFRENRERQKHRERERERDGPEFKGPPDAIAKPSDQKGWKQSPLMIDAVADTG